MLQKMGWSEGSGLGTNGEGLVDHVKVQMKADNLGIGADRRNVDNWLDNSSAFDTLLQNLNSVSAPGSVREVEPTATKKKSKKSSRKDEEAAETEIKDSQPEKEIPKALQSGRL